MEHLLLSYRDPLFSILLIVGLAFVIAAATYGWNLYKHQKEEGRLLRFLDRFDSSECTLDTTNMPFEEHLFKPLTLLAKAFENAGEYHKAINIYLYLIKHANEESLKLELMERLGTIYLRAGFLERARTIYVEILRKRPRNVKVLSELMIVYETMRQYDRAEETLEPLETLGEEVASIRNHLHFLRLVHDTNVENDEKVCELETLLKNHAEPYRDTLAALFRLDTSKAWRYVDTERLEDILDILWFLPVSQLDLDIIANDKKLATLYYAKGYRTRPSYESGIFSIDVIAKAKANGLTEAGLEFSYLCKSCKHTFPVPFMRCPNCMTLYSLKVEESIAKISAQESHSLF
jgi:tetratricopeptide (TPR) repeat protein